jgi:hypothetical protein
MRSNAGSIAWNLRLDALHVRRDRAVVDDDAGVTHQRVAILDVTGKRASECTIQNSVSVRSTLGAFQFAVRRGTSSAAAHARGSSPRGAAESSLRRNSAAMRAARCGRLASLVR